MNDAVQRAAQALSVDRVTIEVVPAFTAAGIDSILLKGPSFRALLYPEGGRAYGDVDLLVRASDVAAATAVLTERGFVDLDRGLGAVEHPTRAIPFVRRANGVSDSVDLHWNLAAGVGELDVPVDPSVPWRVLSARTERMAVGGVEVTILDVPARALHVALHAAVRVTDSAAEDLRRAVRAISVDDWLVAAGIADELGIPEAFAFGLRLDPGGVALAERLGLTTEPPVPWHFAGPATPTGAKSLSRMLAAPTWRERIAVLLRALVPSRSRVRMETRSAASRRWLAAAYLEYWSARLRGAIPALRSGWVLARQARRSRRT